MSVAVSILLWLMSAAALGMSAVYSKLISELSGVRIDSVLLGHSLLLLGIVLCVLSIASTLGTVLTTRSWRSPPFPVSPAECRRTPRAHLGSP